MPADFETVLRSRRSVRRFKPDDVPDEVLTKVLELARWAPSGANRQPWQIVVVRDPDLKRALSDSARAAFFDINRHIHEAPLVIVTCSHPGKSAWHLNDGSNLTMCLLLAAHNSGLGACWIGLFNEEKVREILGIPSEVKVVALVPMGYPAEEPTVPPRLEVAEMTFYDGWGKRKGELPRGPQLLRRGIPSIISKAARHGLRVLGRQVRDPQRRKG